jgi:hypothetical protein
MRIECQHASHQQARALGGGQQAIHVREFLGMVAMFLRQSSPRNRRWRKARC